MREIEIKLKVKNSDELEKKLIEKGCIFSEPINQHDVVYSTGPETGARLTATTEGHLAIRIRREGDRAELNLKQQKSNEMDNIEWESLVENPGAIHNILGLLGWKPRLEVKKVRKKGKLGEYKICLDKVDKLGDFIELEKMTHDDDDPEKVRNELFKALEPFRLTRNDEETKGYDTQMYQLKNN